MIRIFSTLFLACLLFLVAAILYGNNRLQQPTTPLSEPFVIPKGKSLSWVSRQLEQLGVIPDARIFELYHRISQQKPIKAGEFDLSKTISQKELISKMTTGDVIAYQVTLIDGWTFKQFREHLAKQSNLKSIAGDMTDKEILSHIGANEPHPEGLFAPETYFFQRGDSDLDILKRSYKRQKALLESSWNKSGNESKHIDTPYKALILASIIEKETGQSSEREIISGVFHNRLKIGMKLQTDPTVIYGMGDKFDGNIRRKDLITDTPYNTYTRYGLPPTPIAMPGKASILAALNPAVTKSYYFVGKGDGSHYFSETLAEHNKAVRKYQLGQ